MVDNIENNGVDPEDSSVIGEPVAVEKTDSGILRALSPIAAAIHGSVNLRLATTSTTYADYRKSLDSEDTFDSPKDLLTKAAEEVGTDLLKAGAYQADTVRVSIDFPTLDETVQTWLEARFNHKIIVDRLQTEIKGILHQTTNVA